MPTNALCADGVFTMFKTKMTVSKTEGTGDAKKRVAIGDVFIWIPTLTEIAAAIGASEQAKDDKGQPAFDEDGFPVYTTQEANWIQTQIGNAAKMNARNKLEAQSVKVKDGLKIAESFAELTEEGQRSNSGEGLAILREAKEAFGAYVKTLGKTEATSNLLITLFGNRQALGTQSADVKTRMKGYVESFAVSLSDELAERLSRPLEAVIKACETATDLASATDF
ncbi:hypothetical protein Tiera_055 [Polaromonas phage Tiera]|nr:hypothetical protein Tiera_055 [Polaromonas phage Tiera]